jgi:hypothetical protein
LPVNSQTPSACIEPPNSLVDAICEPGKIIVVSARNDSAMRFTLAMQPFEVTPVVRDDGAAEQMRAGQKYQVIGPALAVILRCNYIMAELP